jgi:putative serine protease PepD
VPVQRGAMRTPRPLLVVAAASILGGAAGTGVALGLRDDGSTTTTTTTSAAVASGTPASEGSTLSAREIYRRAADSVAYITARGTQASATGTGFVVDADGLIVTNEHVVDGSGDITVKLGDGTSRKATVVGQDKSTDIALLKIDIGGGKLTPLKLADSSKVQIGDATFAIGNPFGLEDTLTTGVISATQRQITAPNGFSISGVLQTDAALNPGNSGGPLLDDQGDVIGINSQIESNSSGQGSSEASNTGVGFAIPSNTVRRVIAQLREGGQVAHAYLGVSTSDATGGGATVQSVSAGGPAASAGLQAGAVIVAVDDQTVVSSDDLSSAIDAHKPGDEVKLSVRSGGRTQTATVKLGERPGSAG